MGATTSTSAYNVGGIEVIVIIVIIFIFLLVAGVIILFRTINPLNRPCSADNPCPSQFTCVSGLCKSNAGGPCSTDSDCAQTNAICLGGKCITIFRDSNRD